MDSSKQGTSAATKNKLSKTIHNVIHLKKSTKTLSHTSFCLLIPHKPKPNKPHSQNLDKTTNNDSKNRAAIEAFMAKLFAAVSAVKCSYAELQLAQFPYDSNAIQAADEAIVRELKALSELKQSFLKKQFDSSHPHVTMLLAEIHDQQSLMKMYEITMKKMQWEVEAKDNSICTLREELGEIVANNKSLEKQLNSSGQFSVLDCVKCSGPNSFNLGLHYCLRGVRCFVKLMIREMEASSWDIEAAANAIEPEIVFPNPNYRCFAFESFVCREMFDGFGTRDFLIPNEGASNGVFVFVERFKKLKGTNPVQFLKKNPDSGFGKFVRAKYLRLVHPKMETSFSGNLNQRKQINSGEFPESSALFAAFAEMAKRVWLLHCLAFSIERQVEIFQVARNCRFSEVYMESVTDDGLAAAAAEDGGFRVAFTVVPGFKIGKTVVQSQVYLFPPRS